MSKGTFEETDKSDGKPMLVKRMILDRIDLKTMGTIVTDNLTGASNLTL